MNWTQEMKQFLEDEQYGISRKELTEKFNARFGLSMSEDCVHSACKRYGLKNGRDGRFYKGQESPTKGKKMSSEVYAKSAPTMFKKGQVPHNHLPVGSRRWRDYRGHMVEMEKIAEPNDWEFVHRLNWIREKGPIPEGSMVIFADGDTRHNSIENLMLETKTQHCVKNRWFMNGYDRESQEALQKLADLKVAVKRRSK